MVTTLLFSTLYPSASRPRHGIFVETRLRHLLGSGKVQTRVVAPVPWFPFANSIFGEYAKIAATPRREFRYGIDVLHPRYPVIPKLGMSIAPFLLAAASVLPIQRLIDDGFEFDVLDAHYFYPDGVAAALLARYFDKPLAITARGTDLNLIPQHSIPRRLIQWAARRADASIGVCAALTEVLRDWGIDPQRLHVFRNGVDLLRFSPLPTLEARRALGISKSPVLISVGYLIERKGHHVAIESMPQILRTYPNAQMLIVGEGKDRPRLESLIHTLELVDHVRLVGPVPNEKLAYWYSAADALILASSREGWANVLLEAMACGTPVIATRIWGTPEVVADERVGLLVDQRKPDALAAAILKVLARPHDRAAVRHYAEGFGWEQTTQSQVDLFHRLARISD